eukprot:gnl/TRDRNA2_/TRDRNA2_85752_c0_seq1.p1 gnl/TRDRNA2_/TRDRNA2_85752_c0~~gnl/TRDRNA2_/TRDRNA2_85752_c0_seq1.p1  ORF type:complete len:195 (+),score=24.82 gnl/TRDRNA2_/TRDRNA2_85752_c0_seq1:73-657(+)
MIFRYVGLILVSAPLRFGSPLLRELGAQAVNEVHYAAEISPHGRPARMRREVPREPTSSDMRAVLSAHGESVIDHRGKERIAISMAMANTTAANSTALAVANATTSNSTGNSSMMDKPLVDDRPVASEIAAAKELQSAREAAATKETRAAESTTSQPPGTDDTNVSMAATNNVSQNNVSEVLQGLPYSSLVAPE